MIRVTCLGAAGSVTGSNYLIEDSKGKKIMVDCGLFQGGKEMEKRNWMEWGFEPRDIDALILTHAHIDHSGRIPKLVKDGFTGKIITSPPTAELCEIMLLDSAHVQEMDAEWQSRKNHRQGKKGILPLYTSEDAQKSLTYLSPAERDRVVRLDEGIRFRLRNAGHILGSSLVELWIEDTDREVKLVFSGDLGNQNQLIVKDPYEVDETDFLFIESTYGNRLHRSFDDSKAELLEAIRYAVSNNEKVVIPAFAMERTQEILYLLGEFYRDGSLPDVPVYLDSPLAIKATEIFRKNKKYYDEEARAIVEQGFDPFDMPNLKFTPTTEESISINEKPGPAIIVAASGMCTAGRIKHHLKHNLWRPGASIIIVGFQAQGTTGRKIVDGEKHVKIFRENVAVKAKVFTIGGFSAHADQAGLLEWVSNLAQAKPKVFIVHGEPAAAQVLADKIEERFNLETHIPVWKETLALSPGQSIRKETVPEEAIPEIDEAILNSITAVEEELVRLKKTIEKRGKTITENDLRILKHIEENLKDIS
ncbi:MAG: MBL fold metallo-hydrolase [Deltaproteobacteria bacterium]|nr:MBL fold metallo-hydrolase [Deltaproteobacteria bacterium]